MEKLYVGQRNSGLSKKANSLTNKKLTQIEAYKLLMEWNYGFCVPPLPKNEVKSMAKAVTIEQI